MAGKHKIYKHPHPVRTVILIVVSVLFVLALTFTILFFRFQKYIVYTDNGLYLDVPWLEETQEPAKTE